MKSSRLWLYLMLASTPPVVFLLVTVHLLAAALAPPLYAVLAIGAEELDYRRDLKRLERMHGGRR